MAEQVRVNQSLDFQTNAEKKGNVVGPMLEQMVHFSDHFDDDTLSTFKWAVTVGGTNDAISIATEEGGGICTILTGSVDNDSSHLSTSVIWNGTKKAVFETRITIDTVASTYNFFGFSDEKNESNGEIAIEFPLGTYESNAVDAVGFVVDADQDTSSIMLVGVANTTDETEIDTGVDWADGETKTLRVELNGTASIFYLDGIRVGEMDASQTTGTLLCGSIQCGTRDNGGSTNVDVHRVDIWQDE